jgi:protein phosphatase
MLELEFAQASDRGIVRDHNEDYLGYALPEVSARSGAREWLFALADGVGGQDLGEVASRTAVETLLAGFRRARNGEQHGAMLPRLVREANTKVFETGMASGRNGAAMATTLVTCALRFDRIVVSHVGDSRCYRIRHRHAEALTRDHTVTNEQVLLGVLSTREAAEAQTSHLLSRSLGSEMFVSVDTHEHQVLPGDVFLLCSDGLHNLVTPPEMADCATHHARLEDAVQELVDLANQRGGNDNVSVQLIRIRSVERVGMYRGRPYKLA